MKSVKTLFWSILIVLASISLVIIILMLGGF